MVIVMRYEIKLDTPLLFGAAVKLAVDIKEI